MSEKILVLEDDQDMNMLMSMYLKHEGFEVHSAFDGTSGIELFYQVNPDLVISDVQMPGINGYKVCRKLKADSKTRLTPIILLTSLDDEDSYVEGIRAGADDFINKPANRRLLAVRIKSLLKTKRLNDRLDNSWSLLFSMARAVEAKDSYTEDHTTRVGEMSRKFGQVLKLPEEDLDILYRGGIMHDIGKIGVPDQILNKPGRLTDEEFEQIKRHATMGKEICEPLNSMRDIVDIVHLHHEKYNGKGYPMGLKGHEIPLLAQIISIVDVYDALISDRPYREGFPQNKVLDIMESETGQSFNPRLINIFFHKVLEV